MREIKFRAFIKHNRNMLPHVFVDSMAKEIELPDRQRIAFKFVEIMQFTGLKDKKKKEIYEGDILQYDEKGFPNKEKSVVRWLDNWYCAGQYIHTLDLKLWKIIGNIYENPELLKKLN